MRFSAALSVALIVVSLQVLISFALPKKNSHHHKGHRRHEIKFKTPPTKETSSEKILTKISMPDLGLGLSENSASFPEIFGLEKTEKLPDNVKTKTKTTTKVNGPFKTVTKVTQEFKTDKHNKTHMIGQSVQSTTTSRNSMNNTVDAKRRPGMFSMDLSPFGFSLFAEPPERECHEEKPCKEKGTYCDQNEWECKPLVKHGMKCYQPGQCESGKKGKHACVWGTCTLTTKTGDAGTFCKKDSECASDDMRCAPQKDLSEFSDICVPKPGVGETCGRRRMFDLFSIRESVRSSPCKKGFACVEVGNFGRKICRSESFLKDQEIKEDY